MFEEDVLVILEGQSAARFIHSLRALTGTSLDYRSVDYSEVLGVFSLHLDP